MVWGRSLHPCLLIFSLFRKKRVPLRIRPFSTDLRVCANGDLYYVTFAITLSSFLFSDTLVLSSSLINTNSFIVFFLNRL